MSVYTEGSAVTNTDMMGAKQIQKIFLNRIASQIAKKSISKMNGSLFKAPKDSPAFDMASAFVSNFLEAHGLEMSLYTAYEETSGFIRRDRLPIPIGRKLGFSDNESLFAQLVSSTRHGLTPLADEPPQFKKERRSSKKQPVVEAPTGSKKVVTTSRGLVLKDEKKRSHSEEKGKREEKRSSHHHSHRHRDPEPTNSVVSEEPGRHHHGTHRHKSERTTPRRVEDTFSELASTAEAQPKVWEKGYGLNKDKRERTERHHKESPHHHSRHRSREVENTEPTYSEVSRTHHRSGSRPHRSHHREPTYSEAITESYVTAESYHEKARKRAVPQPEHQKKVVSRSVPKPTQKEPAKMTFKERVRKIMMQSNYVDRETMTVGIFNPADIPIQPGLGPSITGSYSKHNPDPLATFMNGPIDDPSASPSSNKVPSGTNSVHSASKAASNAPSNPSGAKDTASRGTKQPSQKDNVSKAETDDLNEDEGEDAPEPEVEEDGNEKDPEEDKKEKKDKKGEEEEDKGEEEEDKGEEEEDKSEEAQNEAEE